MEAKQLRAGDVWRDMDGRVIVAVAQIHGGRVLLCRPSSPDESPETTIAHCLHEQNLRVRPLKRLDIRCQPGQNTP